MKQTTGFYPRLIVDTATSPAVGQAGGVLLTETITSAGTSSIDATALQSCSVAARSSGWSASQVMASSSASTRVWAYSWSRVKSSRRLVGVARYSTMPDSVADSPSHQRPGWLSQKYGSNHNIIACGTLHAKVQSLIAKATEGAS